MKSASNTTTRKRTASGPVLTPVTPAVGGDFPLVLGEKVTLGMVWCPPTSPEGFRMGALESEPGRGADERAHQVVLTKGFWVGCTPVTQKQWEAVMGTNPSHYKGGNRPVEKVSWDDSMEFCRKLAQSERVAGRIPDGYEYTLPTEAQWEYACRAGTTYDYGQLRDAMGWHLGNSDGRKTHPVGLKQANRWGLHDMHGNVVEWCSDWYGDYPVGPNTDPIGPTSGSRRLCRGGNWFAFPSSFGSSAIRYMYEPGTRIKAIGFRLALAPQVIR